MFMKKSVLSVAVALVALTAGAFTPNTKWPYMYEDFTEGTLYRGKDYSVAQFNIHYMGNVLHYISENDDKIYSAMGNEVDSVVIDGKKFVLTQIDGQMMEVTAQSGSDMVLRLDYADFDAVQKGNAGAYGASLNSASTRNLSSLEIAGMNNPQHGLLLQNKKDGISLGVRSRYYMRIGKLDIEANKKSLEMIVPADRMDEWKQFLKKNKIKWKKTESLEKILDFFQE